MSDDLQRDLDRVAQEITRIFLGPGKRRRAKPHRCLGCGKVTKHVFCPDTAKECYRLYREKRGAQ